MPVIDVTNMKVADLKRELKVRGLSITGNKTELQDRLHAVMESEGLWKVEDSSLVGEDILDEEGVLSDEEKILGADENELLKSPTTTPTTILPKTLGNENKDSAALDDILESPTAVTKKIVLKRSSLDNTNTAKENTEPPSSIKPVKMSERHPITMTETRTIDIEKAGSANSKKVKELTMQERLELRAKKFGIEPTKAVAATSIAMTAKEKNVAISIAPLVSNEKQVELLKKRAERFGCVTSTNLAKLDAEEKLLKRKQRFGGEAEASAKTTKKDAPSASATKIFSDDEWAEKARKRLERFKGNGSTVSVAAATEVSTSTVATTKSA